MHIFINNQPVELPSAQMNIEELLEFRHFPAAGTAVALNDHLVTRAKWTSTLLNEGDNVTIISAAFGG